MAKSITWPESDWACISLAGDKTEGKMPQEQAGTEYSCSRGLAEHHQGWKQPSIKKWKLDLWLLVCPITFGPLKSGRHV